MATDFGGHIIGIIAREPSLTTLPNGQPVANFTVEALPRHRDRATGEWKDKPRIPLRCNAFSEMAGNVAQSLKQGDHVVAIGRYRRVRFIDPGTKLPQYDLEMDVDAIGLDLRHTTIDTE